ncbi:sporulation integral membrane protein YlbJ [Paenibacillus doosanensis]|uniref:Sporulation integral membrane protein YlbJ n=1 Tax=Paenibacillus konkukensis TaxID=2020716 RepID=A0ABY4RLR8_9BACL|nr:MULTISPECIES: sporulation integral membrane protein YlbJ [Paenibacillus]MCS7463522.1 sporulation integral membrane protein YlbJ [Paenibacillus doosanensis]UQZ83394.1 Sporulation integral membrane protein YlbJ [Paenibacillus konkukensis]
MLLKKYAAMTLVSALLLCLLLLMLAFPAEVFRASLKGLSIWWDVLFPALFPFFVISEMMLGIGLVHFFGTLLDPLMRPVFRIPGIGGFVVAMGFASGYPIGAKLTSQLWEQKLINREEGERLVSFTTSSDPIFLIGAVSVGFFHDAGLAGILAAAHYGTAMLLGVLMRYHGRKGEPSSPLAADSAALSKAGSNIWTRAFETMHASRMRDGRPIGEMLKQAVSSSLQLVFVLGGLVVLFSAVIEVMSSAHIMNIFYIGINAVLQQFDVPLPLSHAVVNGIFEVTLGAKSAGGAGDGIPLMYKVAIAAFVLSWAGLSVHAQVVSVLHRTNLRYFPFFVSRLLHALMACFAVFVLWEPMQPSRSALAAFVPAMDVTSPLTTLWRFTLPWGVMTFALVLMLFILLFILRFVVKACMKRLV